MLQIGHYYVSNDMAVSPISTFACLAPGQETCTSLNALVDFRGAMILAPHVFSMKFGTHHLRLWQIQSA